MFQRWDKKKHLVDFRDAVFSITTSNFEKMSYQRLGKRRDKFKKIKWAAKTENKTTSVPGRQRAVAGFRKTARLLRIVQTFTPARTTPFKLEQLADFLEQVYASLPPLQKADDDSGGTAASPPEATAA